MWLIRVELPGYAPVAVQQRLEPGPGERVWELQLTRRLVALELRLGPPRALRRATLRLTASDRPGLPPIEAPVAGPRTTVSRIRCSCAANRSLLSRRTRQLLLDAKAAIAIAPYIAKLMAEEMGKDEDWIKEQINIFSKVAVNYTPTLKL